MKHAFSMKKFLSLINSIKQRDALIIGGDFNAKTKLQVLRMEDELGVENYLNSKVNENGNLLTEFCKLHNILITNTIFWNKLSHQTTWSLPLPKKSLLKSNSLCFAEKIWILKMFDSRYFDSNIVRSNHKLVIAKIQIKWTYTKNATGTKSFNLSKLQNTQITENYMKLVNEIMKNQISTTKIIIKKCNVKPRRMEQYKKH